MPLEILNIPLVLLCARARVERPEVPAPVGPPNRFAGIEPVPAVVESPNHDLPAPQARFTGSVAPERPKHNVMHKHTLIVLLFFIHFPFF